MRQINESLKELYATIEPTPSLVQSDVAKRMDITGIPTVVSGDIVSVVRQLEQKVREHDCPGADKLIAYGN